jgi:hypothetical protein
VNIERNIILYDFNPLENTKFESYQLKKNAILWWGHLKKNEKVDEDNLSWD